MPLPLVILLVWFAVSLIVAPLVGMAMRAGRETLAPATPSGATRTSRATTLGAA